MSERVSDTEYRIGLSRGRWFWTAYLQGQGLGNISGGPMWMRRSREKALARAERWCRRQAERDHVETVRFDLGKD